MMHINRAKTPAMMVTRLASAVFTRKTLVEASGVNHLDPELVEQILGKFFCVSVSKYTYDIMAF